MIGDWWREGVGCYGYQMGQGGLGIIWLQNYIPVRVEVQFVSEGLWWGVAGDRVDGVGKVG